MFNLIVYQCGTMIRRLQSARTKANAPEVVTQLQQRKLFTVAIETVIRTFDKVALGLFNTAVLGGLPLVAAALLVGSFAG